MATSSWEDGAVNETIGSGKDRATTSAFETAHDIENPTDGTLCTGFYTGELAGATFSGWQAGQNATTRIVLTADTGNETDGTTEASGDLAVVNSQLGFSGTNPHFVDIIGIEVKDETSAMILHNTSTGPGQIRILKVFGRNITSSNGDFLIVAGGADIAVQLGVIMLKGGSTEEVINMSSNNITTEMLVFNVTSYSSKSFTQNLTTPVKFRNCAGGAMSNAFVQAVLLDEDYCLDTGTTTIGVNSTNGATAADIWVFPDTGATGNFHIKAGHPSMWQRGEEITESWFPTTDMEGTDWEIPLSLGCFETDGAVAQDIYYSSVDGSDGDDGLTWANAKATAREAIIAAGPGGRVFADSANAESVGIDIDFLARNSLQEVKMYSVDRTGNPEPPTALLAGASITTTGDMTFSDHVRVVGFDLSANSMSFGPKACKWIFEQGSLTVLGANRITYGSTTSANATLELIDTDFAVGNSATEVFKCRQDGNGILKISGGALTAADAVDNLFDLLFSDTKIDLKGVDLSLLDGSFVNGDDIRGQKFIEHERCKFHANFTPNSTPFRAPDCYHINGFVSDDADTTYRFPKDLHEGAGEANTTIVRTGGATDGTQVSWKMTTIEAADHVIAQFVSHPIDDWTESTSSKTFTVEFIHDSLTNLTNAEIWAELEYPGADAQGDRADNRVQAFETAADQSSSGETWVTTGLTNPNKQRLSVTVTPSKAGQITMRVSLLKKNTTVYIDPIITES